MPFVIPCALWLLPYLRLLRRIMSQGLQQQPRVALRVPLQRRGRLPPARVAQPMSSVALAPSETWCYA